MNKTLNSGIILPAQSHGHIPHHALVVLRERDGGRTLLQTVMPGKKFRKPWYVGGTLAFYHVSLDARLRHEFGYRLLHSDDVHAFTLRFQLSYRVLHEHVDLPVTHLGADPLNKIEEEITRVLTGSIRMLDWSVIEDNTDLTALAVDALSMDDNGDLVANLEQIRIHARYFGFDVRRIAITRHLDEADLELVRRRIEAEKQAQLRTLTIRSIFDQQREEEAKLTVQHEHARHDALYGAQTNVIKVLGAATAGSAVASGAIAEGATSFPQIGTHLQQLGQIAETAQRVMPIVHGREYASDSAMSAPPRGSLMLPAATSSPLETPGRNAEAVLQRAYEVAAALPVPEPEQRQFLAAILRLQAARMAVAGDDEIEKCRTELQELHRAHALDMHEDHTKFIADLVQSDRSAQLIS